MRAQSAKRLLRRHKNAILIGSGVVVGGILLLGRGGRVAPRLTLFAGYENDPTKKCGVACDGDCRDAFVIEIAHAYAAAGAPAAAVPLLAAHSGLATGFGRCVWNHNIGVLRATTGWKAAGHPWVRLGTAEVIGGRTIHMAGDFRAYPSLAGSAADALHLISTAARYRTAWALLAAGDPAWFAELGAAGYYTEPVAEHFPRYLSAVAEVEVRLA